MPRLDIFCLPEDFSAWTKSVLAQFDLVAIKDPSAPASTIKNLSRYVSDEPCTLFVVSRSRVPKAAIEMFRYSGGVQAWPSQLTTGLRRVLTKAWFAWHAGADEPMDGGKWMRWLRSQQRGQLTRGTVGFHELCRARGETEFPRMWYSVGALRAFTAGTRWKDDVRSANEFAPA